MEDLDMVLQTHSICA